MPSVEQTRVILAATFPEGYFLENLAVRGDGSILVTAMNKKELWLVPASSGDETVEPQLVHTFELMTMFVVEIEAEAFIVATSDVYGTREAKLYRLDLHGWQSGQPVEPALVLDFPEPHVGLNGGCLIAPRVLLAAGAADLIWRVDLPEQGGQAAARVWLRHDSMKNRPGEKKPEQPGVNGMRYAAQTHALFFTSTSQQLMLRVAVDPDTLEPADCRFLSPEVGSGTTSSSTKPPASLTSRRTARTPSTACGSNPTAIARAEPRSSAIRSPMCSLARRAAPGDARRATMAAARISRPMAAPPSRPTASKGPPS